MAEYINVEPFDEKELQPSKDKRYHNREELIEEYQKWVHEK